jgi:hypothetical protein
MKNTEFSNKLRVSKGTQMPVTYDNTLEKRNSDNGEVLGRKKEILFLTW